MIVVCVGGFLTREEDCGSGSVGRGVLGKETRTGKLETILTAFQTHESRDP